jgi:hypothetical protein
MAMTLEVNVIAHPSRTELADPQARKIRDDPIFMAMSS